MGQSTKNRRRLIALIGCLIIAAFFIGALTLRPSGSIAPSGVITPSPTTAPAQDSAARCANQSVAPTSANVSQIRAAILCLTNVDRARRHLRPLKENPRLRRAALGHSSDMVRHGYFSHTSEFGGSFVDRIVVAGYVHRRGDWSLGENLAWGTGGLSTAAEMERRWMHSSGHKANIVKARYREIGIGVHLGIPTDEGVGATYTTNFGFKG
jgi:uncharacterized protein YkwD